MYKHFIAAIILVVASPAFAATLTINIVFDDNNLITGGTGTLTYDTTTQLVSDFSWNIGGNPGSLDNSFWDTGKSSLLMGILTAQDFGAIADCGAGDPCSQGYLPPAGLQGFPSNFMLMAISATGIQTYEIDNGMGRSDPASFTATVVPLPAAAWLFISGLAGLFGIKRYRGA